MKRYCTTKVRAMNQRRRFSYDTLINVNKNLKVRCIVFDVEVLTGNEDDINARKRLEIEEKYNKTPVTSPVYNTANEIHNVSTIQTKYMTKIRNRIGDKSVAEISGGLKETDAKMMSRAKNIPMPSESSKPSRWLLQSGMGDVLDYSSFRSINVALISKKTSAHLIDQLAGQLTAQKFYTIHQDDKVRLVDKFQEMEKELNLNANEFLILSQNDNLLEAAKLRQFYTCRYRPPNSLYGKVSTDFVAQNAIEIQDCIEELNGIAMRSSAYNSRVMK